MSLFGRSRRGKSVKFDFYIQIQSLAPWPAHFSYMTVTWQRGATHKGQTKAVRPTPGPSGTASYIFDEGFHLPCTLFQVPAPAPPPQTPVRRRFERWGAVHLAAFPVLPRHPRSLLHSQKFSC